MQPSKLPVMPKKFLKLFTTTNVFTPSKPFYWRKFSGRDRFLKNPSKRLLNWYRDIFSPQTLRGRMLLSKQMYPPAQKPNQLLFKKKESFYDHRKFLNVVLTYLNISSTASKLDKIAKSLWNIDIPLVTKSKKGLVKPKSEFKGRSVDTTDHLLSKTPAQKKEMKYSSEKLNKKNEFDIVFKKLSEEYNGSAEEKLHTDSKSLAGERKKPERIIRESSLGKRMPTNDFELPPRRRCRLSCPLPPPEFLPEVSNEFLPYRLPPCVKFSSQPGEFLPHKKQSKETEYNSLKTSHLHKPTLTIPVPNSQSEKSVPKAPKMKKKHKANLNHHKPRTYGPVSATTPKMKALLFEPTELVLGYNEVAAPTRIHKDEIVVQVIYSGVCGTDLSILDGKMPCGDQPIILGHEISGKVYAAGSEVSHVKEGDYVAVNPYTSCGLCRYCARGLFSSCINEGLNNSIGINKNGGWAEFIVLKKTQVHKLPRDITLEQASLLQPLSCILSAMSKMNITNGLDVLIQGLGLAGCLWASILHFKGHRNVFVCEKDEKKKQRFLSLNLGYAFVPPEDIGQFNADIIIECSGSPIYIEKALQILNPKGQICFFGKPSPTTEIRCLPYDIVKKEITILGNSGNTFSFSEAIELASVMGDRYLKFDKLGIRAFNIEQYLEALQQKRTGDVGKVMFKFDD